MTPERWRHIQSLFHEALERPAHERAAFLDEACAGDTDLRARVDDLLSADDDPSPLFDASPDDLLSALPRPPGAPSDRIGPYRIEQRIGRGGMGVVYRARDTRLNRTVALKFLSPHLSANDTAKHRFITEARAASALDHPHICTVHDVGEANGRLYIAMAYYEGRTLKQRMKNGPLPVAEALRLITPIAEALAAAHGRGIIHRDVKPGNVLLTNPAPGQARGLVKLLDFGLAKMAGQDLTQTGTTMGTAAYMSPEQALGEAVDQRTDLWSLGVILYEMLAGERPFKGEHAQSVIHNILHTDPEPLPTLRPDVPVHLAAVVHKALAKDPEARYRHAAHLLADLRRTDSDTNTFLQTADTLTDKARSSTRSASRTRRRATLYGGLAALVVLAGLWLVLRPENRTTRVGEPATGQASVAVLPFVNLSPDEANEYFSDGLTEEVLQALARIDGLRVPARTSVFAFKKQERDIREIGRVLDVEFVVEGSVRRDGDRVRIAAQLIDVADGYERWSHTFDRQVDAVLDVQEAIARAIVDQMQDRLGRPVQAAEWAVQMPEDPEAYTLYLKGRYFWNKRTPADIRRSITHFEDALDRDPAYARAYAGLADAYAMLGSYGAAAPEEAYPRARAAAERALEIDPALAEAYVPLALAHTDYYWNWDEAEAHFRRALELNPNYATAHHQYAVEFLSVMGRHDEAVHTARRAAELDPLSPIIQADLSRVYRTAGRIDEAFAQLESTLELTPGFFMARLYLGITHAIDDRHDQAAAVLEELKTTSTDSLGPNATVLAFLGYVYARAGDARQAREVLDEIEALDRRRPVDPFWKAMVYGGLGDNDRAFAWLDSAYVHRSPLLIYLKEMPYVQPLRDDPRADTLLESIDLAPR